MDCFVLGFPETRHADGSMGSRPVLDAADYILSCLPRAVREA